MEGIAVAKCTYLNGCIQYSVQGRINKAGDIPKEIWIDEQQLQIISDGVISSIRNMQSMSVPGGGHRSHPQ